MRARAIVAALLLAGAAVVPLSTSATASGMSAAACKEGASFAAGKGIWTCAQGQYVITVCPPGTEAVQQGFEAALCDYA